MPAERVRVYGEVALQLELGHGRALDDAAARALLLAGRDAAAGS